MNKIKVLFSILERGKGKEYIARLSEQGVKLNLQTIGHGTAPSEMKDIFGLVSSEKDIVISFAPEMAIGAFAFSQSQVVGGRRPYGGIAAVMPIAGLGRVTAEIIERASEKGGRKAMEKDKTKYALVFISVNEGYSEEVMKTAKKAGATGGTIMRGRLDGMELLESHGEEAVFEEREVISILAPQTVAKEIMESVNAEFGLSSRAKGTVFALPVDKAFKI